MRQNGRDDHHKLGVPGVYQLGEEEGLTVISTGGQVRRESLTLVEPGAAKLPGVPGEQSVYFAQGISAGGGGL